VDGDAQLKKFEADHLHQVMCFCFDMSTSMTFPLDGRRPAKNVKEQRL
jgi:hypothetical protein